VENLSFAIEPGGTLTFLGEINAGSNAVLRLLAQPLRRSAIASGTLQLRGNPEQSLGKPIALDIRTAYLPGPHANVLNPRTSVLSQLSLIIARKLRQPKASASAELALALGRLPGAPALEVLDNLPALVAPEALAAGLLAAAMAQTPELLRHSKPSSSGLALRFSILLRAPMQRDSWAAILSCCDPAVLSRKVRYRDWRPSNRTAIRRLCFALPRRKSGP
jgi:hypothetical protein